jgi:hypothetical protein
MAPPRAKRLKLSKDGGGVYSLQKQPQSAIVEPVMAENSRGQVAPAMIPVPPTPRRNRSSPEVSGSPLKRLKISETEDPYGAYEQTPQHGLGFADATMDIDDSRWGAPVGENEEYVPQRWQVTETGLAFEENTTLVSRYKLMFARAAPIQIGQNTAFWRSDETMASSPKSIHPCAGRTTGAIGYDELFSMRRCFRSQSQAHRLSLYRLLSQKAPMCCAYATRARISPLSSH